MEVTTFQQARPPGQQVERGQQARQVIGVMKGGRERGAEPEMPGHARHDRQDRHGIEIGDLPAVVQVGVEAVLVDVGQAQRVGVEAAVEAGRFEDPRDVFVALGREDVGKLGRRVAPGAAVHRRRPGLEIGHQLHLLLRLGHGFLLSLPRQATPERRDAQDAGGHSGPCLKSDGWTDGIDAFPPPAPAGKDCSKRYATL